MTTDERATIITQLDTFLKLTPRQQKVARLSGEGRSTAHVAEALNLTEQTIKNHLHVVYKKLGMADGSPYSASRRLAYLIGYVDGVIEQMPSLSVRYLAHVFKNEKAA